MRILRILLVLVLVSAAGAAAAVDPLPSWGERPVKAAILAWVAAVTDSAHADFIPVPERIAVLDNDGTCWCERPQYPATQFQIDLARSLAARGLVDGAAMPFKALFADDTGAVRKYGWGKAYTEMNDAFAGMPVTAYRDSARAWIARTPHPRFAAACTDLYYAPMLELMRLLESADFQVWIVTGAVQDFVRAFSEEAIGIPPEHVIGTTTETKYTVGQDGVPVLVRGRQQTGNGHADKPANIETRIGRRPVFAAGNSDNDEPMCRYAVTGPRRGLAIWINHDDKGREYDYGKPGDIGDLCRDNPQAHEVSMKHDWLTVFGPGAGE